MASGPVQPWAEKRRGPASIAKPPVRRTMTSTSRAHVPAAARTRLLKNGKEARILLLAFRRQRPFLAQRLVVLRSEEGRLHAAVDDVPRQHRIARAIAEHEEVGVHAR